MRSGAQGFLIDMMATDMQSLYVMGSQWKKSRLPCFKILGVRYYKRFVEVPEITEEG
eukprot:c43284_g1_i1 orf=3-170(-)